MTSVPANHLQPRTGSGVVYRGSADVRALAIPTLWQQTLNAPLGLELPAM